MSCPYCRREGAPEPSSAPGHQPTKRAPAASPGPRQTARKAARKTGWLLPSLLLVLMPKCPICLAAYIALATGITIPITAATWLRGSLIAGCIGALVWLAVRWSLYLYKRSID